MGGPVARTGWGLLCARVGRGGCLAPHAWSVPGRRFALESLGFPGALWGSAPAQEMLCSVMPACLGAAAVSRGEGRAPSRVLPDWRCALTSRGWGSSGASLVKPGSAACFGVKQRRCLLTASKAVLRHCGWCGGGNSCGVPLVFGVSAPPLAPCLLSVLFLHAPREPANWQGAGAAQAFQLVMLFLRCQALVGLMGSTTAPALPVPQRPWSPEPPLLEELTML